MLNPWAFESDVVRCTYELFKQFNILNSTNAIKELKTVDAYDLIPPLFTDELKINFLGCEKFCFVPTMDEDFIRQPPHIIFNYQRPFNVSLLVGWTSLENEWMISFETTNFKYPNVDPYISNFINDFMKSIFEHDFGNTEKERFIRNFQHISDMSYGIYKFIQNYINSTEQENVFLYRFALDRRFGDLAKSTVNIGAVHGDELKYLFNDNSISDEKSIHFLTKQRMIAIWSNFIKIG